MATRCRPSCGRPPSIWAFKLATSNARERLFSTRKLSCTAVSAGKEVRSRVRLTALPTSAASQAVALLQEYFRERSCTLQILRLEECYLVLISTELDSGTATLGLYYSPVLKTWCGIGLQLL